MASTSTHTFISRRCSAEHNLPLPGYPYALTLSPIGEEKHIPKQWPTTLKNTAISMTKITAIRIDHNTLQRLYTCTQLGLRLVASHKPPTKNGTLLVSQTLAPRKCESIPPELPIGGGAISPRVHEVTQKSSHPDLRSGCYYPHRGVVVLLGEVVLLGQCSSGGNRVMASAVGPADVIVDRSTSTVKGQSQWAPHVSVWVPAVSGGRSPTGGPPRLVRHRGLGSAFGPEPAMGQAPHEARPRDPLRQRSDPVRPAPCGQTVRAWGGAESAPARRSVKCHNGMAERRSHSSRVRVCECVFAACASVAKRHEAARRLERLAATANSRGSGCARPRSCPRPKGVSFGLLQSGSTAGQLEMGSYGGGALGLAHGDPPEQSSGLGGAEGLARPWRPMVADVHVVCGSHVLAPSPFSLPPPPLLLLAARPLRTGGAEAQLELRHRWRGRGQSGLQDEAKMEQTVVRRAERVTGVARAGRTRGEQLSTRSGRARAWGKSTGGYHTHGRVVQIRRRAQRARAGPAHSETLKLGSRRWLMHGGLICLRALSPWRYRSAGCSAGGGERSQELKRSVFDYSRARRWPRAQLLGGGERGLSANYADNVLEGGGPPGLFSPSGLYTHKPPSTLSPEEQPYHAKSSTSSPNPNPIHTKSRKTAMAGGEGSSRSKGTKRRAEAMKEVVTTEKAVPTRDMPSIEDPISDWPTSNLKDKHIKTLEADGFLAAQEISRWRCVYGHEYPTEETEELTYEARRSLYVSLPPLDPTNAEEASLLARCVDPGVKDQVRQHKQSATEEPDERNAHAEQQVPEESHAKAGTTSKGGEGSKRTATTDLAAPVPKRARTLPKPRARIILDERAKISPQPKLSSSVGIAIGEIGTSMSQQDSTARQPLSEEEILHNIFNPISAPFIRITPVVEETCPTGPSAPEQETEEEFILREPEIPMRPSSM
nr:unnamed protein product [Digitaria exilis]